jgi:hypothetical protein
MNNFTITSRIIERVYGWAIVLYPAEFRFNYGPTMSQALRDALADPESSLAVLLPTLFLDLIQSVVKENLAMIRETFARPVIVFNAAVLAVLSTGLSLAIYAIPQQVLRLGANDPQIELAGNAAYRLERGASPAAVVPETAPNSRIDMAESLSPFVIVYDEQGNVLSASADLRGKQPTPPAGVLDYTRSHMEDRLTWQPRSGVYIAAVVRHVSGAQPGFVLAGRNMREVDAREIQISAMAGALWLTMLGVIAAGTFLFGWFTRTPKAAAA